MFDKLITDKTSARVEGTETYRVELWDDERRDPWCDIRDYLNTQTPE